MNTSTIHVMNQHGHYFNIAPTAGVTHHITEMMNLENQNEAN